MLSLAYDATARVQAAYLALGALDKPLRAELRAYGKDYAVPLLMREARDRAAGRPVLLRVIGSGRYSEYRGVPGVAFGGKRPVARGVVPGRVLARGAEFGSEGKRTVTYAWRSPRGRAYELTRRTSVQFVPDTGYRGHAINPAAEAINDDVIAGWVDVVERLLVRAFDGEV